MAAANFSRLTTILFEVLSTEVAMLFAKSEPGTDGGFACEVGDCGGVVGTLAMIGVGTGAC